ncbi:MULTISPECIES: amino acid ABC transporter permease [unclassified Aureimonas]|uniref:amino acid ABC transporter permease n=1 Tax=unclassified Aureimonas TaxID=2615206 RepID=UPI0006FE369A|nr:MULTISPECIES: ABC transporter permease subunit [unclassified Aureimonas]KQT63978.1 ABC transporter permease [Aureimonas sp. Leaf427]KQT81171.1 ABC transporter permease [Aureimonas sp. Leaf460]
MTTGGFWSLCEGGLVTVALGICSILCGSLLGLLLGLLRWLRPPLLTPLLVAWISLLRATPLLTLTLLIFFLAPNVGFDIPAFGAAVLSMSLNTSAFHAEIWRGVLNAFPKEQIEAARAVGMHRALMIRRIVLPQAVRVALPALVNEMTVIVKNSPAVAIIGLVDLTRAAVRIGAETYEPLPPLLLALGFYIAIVASLVLTQRRLERGQRYPSL